MAPPRPTSFVVLTTPHPDAAAWDAAQPFRVVRTREPVLLPTPVARDGGSTRSPSEVGRRPGRARPRPARRPARADLGARRTASSLHGAEVTVPGRLPVTRQLLGRVLRGRRPRRSAPAGTRRRRRSAPPGGACPSVRRAARRRHRPVPSRSTEDARAAARARLGLPVDGPLVVSVSRLVPRKGMDVLIRAAALLAPEPPCLTVAIGGGGRERDGLDRLVREHGRAGAAPRPASTTTTCPTSTAAATCSPCCAATGGAGSSRRASASCSSRPPPPASPQVAGDSGGAAEAVVDGETGLVVRDPGDVAAVAGQLAALLDDAPRRARMGAAGRERAVAEFSYDVLAGAARGGAGGMGG